ncbi:MAG: hypothetical protein IPG50_35105 [Myxococcales bacterium]|nr:hypothetical protein [Myxococcales bacterium]
MLIRTLSVSSLLALLVPLTSACHSDDDHSHTSTFASCTAIIDACHPVDVGAGAIHDCHEAAHNATKEDDCAPKKATCVALCAAAGDGGAAADGAHSHAPADAALSVDAHDAAHAEDAAHSH